MSRKKRTRPRPEPLTGSQAFGFHDWGLPTGSQAVGEPDPDQPLRGALLFGNDPEGNPRGAELIGQPEQKVPLKGALLFGNDPEGNPRGSEAFGGAEQKVPLKGALLFGNDPAGEPRGADTFGGADQALRYRGSASFGAPQLVPEKLTRDDIGYDFGGVLLSRDDGSIAGVRRDARDALRKRILRRLERLLDLEAKALRHGLGEDSIKWGKLKREPTLDRELAQLFQKSWRKAPGEVLGIAQVRDLLEDAERMHTFDLRCEWDVSPVTLSVLLDDAPVAFARYQIHNEHTFFVFEDEAKRVLAYVDALVPNQRRHEARVRAPNGDLVGVFVLGKPASGQAPEAGMTPRFEGVVRDAQGRDRIVFKEERVTAKSFRAALTEPGGNEPIGVVEDKLDSGKIRAHVELDMRLPRTLAWALAVIMADLSRLRKSGWPAPAAAEPDEPIEPIDEALGPRTRR